MKKVVNEGDKALCQIIEPEDSNKCFILLEVPFNRDKDNHENFRPDSLEVRNAVEKALKELEEDANERNHELRLQDEYDNSEGE
jgi:hypothetical protein